VRGYHDLSNSLGTLLRTHRAARGLTQEELADLSGLSVRAIADMERGRTARPYRRSVQRLADALGLSGPARDQLHEAARVPAAATLSYLQYQRADPPDAAAQARVVALPPEFPGQSDEFRLLADVLFAVARTGGSLTVSGRAADGSAGPALELRWASPPAGGITPSPDDVPTSVCD
jgi:transcriptional regulator with XRE-family HTH domain